MSKCEKCGVEVPEDELYDDKGLKVCEDCKINGIKCLFAFDHKVIYIPFIVTGHVGVTSLKVFR